jgi:hypothetical protein
MEVEPTIRPAFERWFSEDGKWPAAVLRDGSGYMLASAQAAWTAWKACTLATLVQLTADGWRQTRYESAVTECEACLTEDACRLRGQCAHYLRERA